MARGGKKDPRNQKHGTDTKNKPMRWEPDILAKDFIPRTAPRPVPNTGIFDEELYCIKFNKMWTPHILGALQILLETDSWSGGNTEIFRAQQSILLMLENLALPCDSEEINMRTPEFRSIVVDENCDQFQWKYVDEPDGSWRNLGTPICDGADGEDGTNGTNGTDGEDGRNPEFQTVSAGEGCFQIQWRYEGDSEWIDSGDPVCCECEETVPPNPVEPEEEDGLYCAIAINMTTALHGVYDESYENADEWFASITGAGGVVTAVAAILFPGIAVGVAVGSAIVSFLSFLNAIIAGAESNAFDSAAEEQFRCDLYCILVAHDTVEITTAIIEEWATKIEEYTIMGEQRFAVAKLLREASPLDYWQWVAYASSEVNPAACDCVCDEDRLISWEVLTSNAEEGTTHIVRLKLTSPAGDMTPSDITVSIQSIPGTATTPADYLLIDTTATFPAGSENGDTIDVEVTIASGDGADDGETFQLEIYGAVVGQAVIDEDNDVHTVTITDDDTCTETDFIITFAGGEHAYDLIQGSVGSGVLTAVSVGARYGVTHVWDSQINIPLSGTCAVKTVKAKQKVVVSPNPGGNWGLRLAVQLWKDGVRVDPGTMEHSLTVTYAVASTTFSQLTATLATAIEADEIRVFLWSGTNVGGRTLTVTSDDVEVIFE